MSDLPTIAELALLRALWEKAPLSAREIHDLTKKETSWSYSSTRKTLERMTEKQFVSIKIIHGVRVFTPTHARLSIAARLIDRFSRTLLGAQKPVVAAAFAGGALVRKDEAEELQMLLDRLAVENAGKATDDR